MELLLGLWWSRGADQRWPSHVADGIRSVCRAAGGELSELGVDAHRASGAGDDARRHLLVVGVEVFHLLTGDLENLVARELGDLGLVRLAGTLGDASGLLDELGGRRGLRHEGERAVLVDRDLDRDDVAALGLRRGVVRLDELHDVDAVLTEGRTDGRGGRGLTGLDLQLDEAGDLLLGGHGCLPSSLWADAVGDDPVAGRCGMPHRTWWDLAQILATWAKDSSTGVSRPKIETSTLSFWVSLLISEIVAGRVSKGPSMTVTDSPTSKSTTRTSLAAPVPVAAEPSAPAAASNVGASIVKTSSIDSGTGWCALPTKPVTPGVWRTAPQLSSVRSMRTRTYPGIRTRRTCFFWPFLISVTSSMGTSISKMKSSMLRVWMRVSRLAFTRFS